MLTNSQTRTSAAVIFRRIASKSTKHPVTGETKELFLTLRDEARVAIRSKLLQSLAGEQVGPVRNKIGDAVAEIARQYVDNGMISHQKIGYNS